MWLPSPVKIIIFNSIWSQHRTSSFSKQASSIPLYSNTWLFYSDPSQQGKSVDIRWLYSPVLIFARSFVFRMKSWWHHCTLSWPSNWSDTPTRELTLLSIRNTTWWIIKSNSSLWPEWAFLESAIKSIYCEQQHIRQQQFPFSISIQDGAKSQIVLYSAAFLWHVLKIFSKRIGQCALSLLVVDSKRECKPSTVMSLFITHHFESSVLAFSMDK